MISNKCTIYNTPSCCEDLYGLEVKSFVNHQKLRSKSSMLIFIHPNSPDSTFFADDANNRTHEDISDDNSRIITAEPETRQLFGASVRFASTSYRLASLRSFHGKILFTKFIVFYETSIFSVCISLSSFSGHPRNVL